MNPGLGIGLALSPAPGGSAAAGGVASYRYYRFSMTSATGIVQIYELRAYETVGGADVLQGKTVTVSDNSTDKALLVDGNTTTVWATGSTPSPQWAIVDAGAGQKFKALLFSVIPRTFSADQTPNSMKIEGSNDASAWTTLVNIPTLAQTIASEERQYSAGGDDATGYRYYWLKQTGNNFAGSATSYILELKFIGALGENLALQNIAFVGNVSATNHADVFGRYTTDLGVFALNDTFGVDLGRKRAVPVSVQISFADSDLFASNGPKNWQLYGSNTNNIATATLLKTVNDTSGTPLANAIRTYAIP